MAKVTHHGTYSTYRVCMIYDHVCSMLFVQRNSIPSRKMLTKSRLHKKLWVFNTKFLILVIRRVPNHSSWTACFGLFKLSTCSSLLIGRGHSTWFGVQILTQTLTHLRTYFYSFVLSTCSILHTWYWVYTQQIDIGISILWGQSYCYLYNLYYLVNGSGAMAAI